MIVFPKSEKRKKVLYEIDKFFVARDASQMKDEYKLAIHYILVVDGKSAVSDSLDYHQRYMSVNFTNFKGIFLGNRVKTIRCRYHKKNQNKDPWTYK